MGKYFHKGQFIVSEHGIYTREREEELIKADWVQRTYKNIWIRQFKKMSKVAYNTAVRLHGYMNTPVSCRRSLAVLRKS